MQWSDVLPDYLRGEACSDTVLIGPRTFAQTVDPAGSPQSLALSTTILGLIRIDAAASIPALTTPGVDIQVGADEALIIEALNFVLTARDASGKLQVGNFALEDSFGPLPLAPLPTVLPYTFAAVTADALDASLLITPRNPLIRATANIPGSFLYRVTGRYILTNTDGAGAHTYTRQLTMVYRRIQGLAPLVPRIYTRPQ